MAGPWWAKAKDFIQKIGRVFLGTVDCAIGFMAIWAYKAYQSAYSAETQQAYLAHVMCYELQGKKITSCLQRVFLIMNVI